MALFNTSPTPGSYMKRCRLRAGKTRAACAEKIAVKHHDRIRAESDIAALETDQPGDYAPLLASLERHQPFPFDPGQFAILAARTCDPSLDECGADA